ncbi:centromere protein I [Nilaparvata lugens]|uniref:centromere protein I n=1 Tax=Nilaparvata lugens TaxID=108931 RepID=UPI00193DCB9B|nr:centromere protein I [Nilaparvata lugens]
MECQPLAQLFDLIQLFKNGFKSSCMPEFINCLTGIRTYASQDGLSDSQLTDLVHFIPNTDLGARTVQLLFDCLIPEKCVPLAVSKKILTHLFMNYRSMSSQKIIPMLRWIIGVLEFKLTDLTNINGFYRLYFFMLDYADFNVHKYVAQIIYMLTTSDDVVEEKVYHVQKIMDASNRPPYLVALMSKFKSLKPQLVPKNIPNGKEMNAIHCLPEEMATAFKNAARRNSPEESMQVDENNSLATTRFQPLPERGCLERIINSYTNYSNSSSFSKPVPLHRTRLQDIDNLYDLHKNIDVIELPPNILSLLVSDIGMQYIALADNDVQERFAISLQDILDKVFLKMTMKASYEEKDSLLRSVSHLETIMQQGISVVTRFLGKFLVCWDGVKFRKSVFSLIEWASFSSYAEFEDLILSKLFNQFCTSQWEVKVEIITCLSNLLTNMHVIHFRRFQKGTRPRFLGIHPQWVADAPKTFRCLIEAIEYFLMVGFIAEPKSNAILHRFISFYSMLFKLEEQMPVMTVVHFSVVYRSMFAQNSAAFRRVCDLILSYRSKITQQDPDTENRFPQQTKLVDSYVNDIMNCLWTGKALSNCESGMILTDLSASAREDLMKINGGNPDRAFMLSNNMMLLPYIYAISKKTNNLDIAAITSTNKIMEVLENYMEEVANLITHALESDNENSEFLSVLT